MKSIFISYSWDSEIHKEWVKKLADTLQEDENFDVIWDGYDLDSLSDKNSYMEKSVWESDYILIVSTKKYKEKSDERKGGVGIEAYMASANHWGKMTSNNKRTNIILLLREPESIPRYLAGHFHIDFTADDNFPFAIETLKKLLLDQARHTRPEKKTSSVKTYHLTKASEIIGIGAKNRTPIISCENGTDFSGGNKIKFELWEVKNPGGMSSHILALHNNIHIGQTLERAADEIIDKNIKISTLQILRPKEKKKGSLSFESILKDKEYKTRISISELTYDEYVWDYCIGSDFKDVIPPDAIEFYTNQELCDADGKIFESSIKALEQDLSELSEYSANLIIGSGGIGKTSLCLSLVNRLITNKENDFLTILIRSEDIRKYIENNKLTLLNINGIYDVYELQAKYLNHINIFDKNTFELSIVSGKIIIVIDGLDELSSIFGSRFDLIEFLTSIKKLHSELGASRIVLTTRENTVISDSLIEELNIKKYTLLGFKIENCEKYLATRFKYHDDKFSITSKIIAQILRCSLSSGNRIIPFFVDVISNIYEDNLNNKESDNDFSLNEDETPYPSLNEINDHIIISIFEREKVRHKFPITHIDMLELFKVINLELLESWKLDELSEVVNAFYDNQSSEILSCILKNPLLISGEGKVNYKYEFLHSYFNSLSIFELMLNPVDDNQTIKLLSKSGKDTPEFKDLVKFLQGKPNALMLLKTILIRVRDNALSVEGKDKLSYERSISAVENIISLVNYLKQSTKKVFSDDIKEMYDATVTNKISGLFINGDLPPLDLTDTCISHSKFKNYSRFLKCDFDGAKFNNTQFINCHNDSHKSSSLLKASIDRHSCDVGDLDYSFNMLSDAQETSLEVLNEEMTKFLASFYKGSNFRENNKLHIRFSNHVEGLRKSNFQKLISHGYFRVKKEKEVDIFYEVSESFKPSVRRFLNDGYKDGKIKLFIKLLG